MNSNINLNLEIPPKMWLIMLHSMRLQNATARFYNSKAKASIKTTVEFERKILDKIPKFHPLFDEYEWFHLFENLEKEDYNLVIRVWKYSKWSYFNEMLNIYVKHDDQLEKIKLECGILTKQEEVFGKDIKSDSYARDIKGIYHTFEDLIADMENFFSQFCQVTVEKAETYKERNY